MNPYLINYPPQNKRALYPNYKPVPAINPIQAPLNNSNQSMSHYIFPKSTNLNPIPPKYNPANIIPPQINPVYQQSNLEHLLQFKIQI